jgi:predicted site-specific integrase-resolvase
MKGEAGHMARVSKKVSAAQREAENAPHRIWKTAIYARLSDFDDVLRDTESLEVQISYIKEYINHRDDLMLLDLPVAGRSLHLRQRWL